MLSKNERQVKDLIETKFLGSTKEETRLFHISVERKLEAVKMWFQNIENILPDFTPSAGTFTTTMDEDKEIDLNSLANIESTMIKISAYIDAFFMSGKSVLDTFVHEIRNLYGFSGHKGNLCFDYALKLISKHHQKSDLELYLTSLNILSSDWYKNLNSYRRTSTHESIIPITPSANFDLLNGQWKSGICKLPDGKNFINVGNSIRDKLCNLIIESYDKILSDMKQGRTKIII